MRGIPYKQKQKWGPHIACLTKRNAWQSCLAGDFQDQQQLTQEYTYYEDGSLSADQNKGITTILYNHLNLPREIHFSGGNYLKYIYDAAGTKLRKDVFAEGSRTSWTDYTGAGMVDERDALQFMPTEAGRVLSPYFAQGSGGSTFAYEYHYQDHLGNLRLSFRKPTGTTSYVATMEATRATAEEAQFVNVASSRKRPTNRIFQSLPE